MTFAQVNLQAAQEGCVLLRNNNQVLPLKSTDKVSIFGRIQFEYYRSGMGSGGSVHVAYSTNVHDELVNLYKQGKGPAINEQVSDLYDAFRKENQFDFGGGRWAAEPFSQSDLLVTPELAEKASKNSSKAIYVIGRTAGEDKDFLKEKGSWYLSDTERNSIKEICKFFEQVIIVFNTCSIIDTAWINEPIFNNHIKGVLYSWAGGMEGGKACANILTGLAIPCGKLADTIAYSIEDYPSTKEFLQPNQTIYSEDIYVGYRYFNTFAKEKIMFPFGFGLSYTTFKTCVESAYYENEKAYLKVNVTNTGDTFSGKEVVQIYVEKPQGKLGKPCRELVAFAKTQELAPRTSCTLDFQIPVSQFASYDDSGVTGMEYSWVLEAGKYNLYCGNDVSSAFLVDLDITLDKNICIEKLEQAAAPVTEFERILPRKTEHGFEIDTQKAPLSKVDLQKRVEQNLPKEIPFTGNVGIKFADVLKDSSLLDRFIGQLSVKELCTCVRGEGMMSHKVTIGVASAFGGVSQALYNYGIPSCASSDGPSGIRNDTGIESTLMPTGTLLACTWNKELNYELYCFEGKELVEYQIDTLLGPGVNIHRNPLNGRNFEYFSEDPYLTGVISTEQLRGLNIEGACGTIKHYACNNQELRRSFCNSILSERALREIYLKAFEMACKSGQMKSLMTSYNPINGHWASSNYDTVNTILRKEWGYKGLVMTDWWAQMNHCVKGTVDYDDKVLGPSVKNAAYMVRASNDVYMVVDNDGAEINEYGDNIEECLNTGELTLGELQNSVKNIIKFIINSPVAKRPLRPLIIMESYEPLKQELPNDIKPVAQDEKYVPHGATQNDYFYFEAPVDGEYNIRGTYCKSGEDLSQSVCNLLINDKAAASMECRSTAGFVTSVNMAHIRLSKGIYKIALEHTKPGIEVYNVELSSIIRTPISMGIYS